MANTVNILGYANTFGDWVVSTNAGSKEINSIGKSDWTKDSGKLTLNGTNIGLNVINNALVNGQLQVQGVGSSALIDNNLTVGGAAYLTNTQISLYSSGITYANGTLYAQNTGTSLSVANNTLMGGTLSVSGATSVGGTLSVSGLITGLQSLNIYNTAYTNILQANTIVTTAAATITGPTYTNTLQANSTINTGTLMVTGKTFTNILQANTTVNTATLTVTGNTYTNILIANTGIFTAGNLTVSKVFTGNTTILPSKYFRHAIQVIGTGENEAATYQWSYGPSANLPYIALIRTRGTSPGDLSVSSSLNETLGTIAFAGASGNTSTNGAQPMAEMGAYIDGTPTSNPNSIPTALYFSTGSTAGSNRMVIRSDGKVGIGTTTPGYTLDVAGSLNVSGALTTGSFNVAKMILGAAPSYTYDQPIQINSNTQNGSSTYQWQYGNTAYAPYIALIKTRGITPNDFSANSAVQTGDLLGSIVFSGTSGTDPNAGTSGHGANPTASIECHVDGAVSNYIVPSSLYFVTGSDVRGGYSQSPTTRMVIRSDGKVGIGTTTPGYTLDVAGSLNVSGAISTSSTLSVPALTVAGSIIGGSISTAGTVSGSQLTSYGNASVASKLYIGDAPAYAYTYGLQLNSNTINGASAYLWHWGDGANSYFPVIALIKSRGDSVNDLKSCYAGDKVGSIVFAGSAGTSSGGGSTGGGAAPTAEIYAQVEATPWFQPAVGGAAAYSYIPMSLGFSTGTQTNNGATRMKIDSAGIITMYAYGSGTVVMSGGVISTTSDENLKIKDGGISNPISKIMALEPGYFYGKPGSNLGTERHLGFYAQNVYAAIGQEAAPVPQPSTTKNMDGTESTVTPPWGFYDRSVLAVVVEALKAQQNEIVALTARIAALENK